jgi:hypothetical protein
MMKNARIKRVLIGITGLSILLFAYCKKLPQAEQIVYKNDFEQSALTSINGGIITDYIGSKVIGRYNNGGFTVNLTGLPDHDFIKISFYLYIHDGWDGDSKGDATTVEAPDLWKMKVDGNEYINATFSNTVCNGVFCLMQSYPQNYPFHNNPKTGASRTDLPGVCHFKGIPDGTTLYKIEKIIKQKENSLSVEFRDMLLQSNTNDPLCDESWSMDNIVISTLKK